MILDSFKLDGKVALVTGADKGLGLGLGLALAEAGADIIGLSRSDSTATAEAVRSLGRRYHSVSRDLQITKVDDLKNVVDEAVREFGGLDILVNNAGTIRRGPALEAPEADWDDVLQVNLKSVFFLSQAAARVMSSKGYGKIINIASMLSFQGGINVISYAAAKSGLAGMTRGLANEWAAHGINVNAIAPGYMATDNTAALREDPKRSASILERIPAARWGTPEDLKGAVIFLASSASDYVNGSILPVDGGWLAR
jgi:2-deoxy-D-gluconate 3-dehydrogenase